MAKFSPFEEHLSIEDQVKSLGDDELLDFWEESQLLARFLNQDDGGPLEFRYSPEYEQAIVQELQIRSCRKQRG
ncbi:MAG: hypothetical protein PHV85_11425 [Desulfovibrionaceae bacterium]|nr:hypothetical protein [Desulfovibrionaceae bacterium]MDD4953151.1 hypothetical protein [Desulfovibrionaceae bacterium]